MSTLNTVNITNGTDSITVEGAVKGSAKAWVNFNGTGVVAIRASFNVSSITDNGVGNYSVNFTTAMPDANYSLVATCNVDLGGSYSRVVAFPYATAPSTTSAKFITSLSTNATVEDMQYISVAIFR